MNRSNKAIVRKGRIYQVQVADHEYRIFIWQTGTTFCGRVEELPAIAHCRGRTENSVRKQLCDALSAHQAA